MFMKKEIIALIAAFGIICVTALAAYSMKNEIGPFAKEQQQLDRTSGSREKGSLIATTDLEPYRDYASEVNTKVLKRYTEDDDLSGLFNPDFSAETSFGFSMGEKDQWKYSGQQKQFDLETVYLKVKSVPKTDHWWGKGKKFDVFYIFVGTKNCNVQVYNGTAKKENIDDANMMIFRKTLEADRDSETTIFKLTPKGQGSLRTDIVYDEKVDKRNDVSSRIDFRAS
jgi:hypothetical protein